ncbi:uncharacterized protein EMH_0043850 [Eimeria mitis]|uniref:Uncharacterized protein n=1 Tax=Eimeria mitis TaxID=44415 RepID=U6JVH2_9EIME|nr:uncharacterized protein EMH_0043850 [Eimeria mitis]CDJ28776.1 hypothetical protein, conserved [Eimeria mitis]
MSLPAEGKPQVQLICERLIDKFASRLEKDKTLDIPLETREEFLRKEGRGFGLQSERSPGEETQSNRGRRVNAGDSDDEFADANLDTLGYRGQLIVLVEGQEFPFSRMDADLREI